MISPVHVHKYSMQYTSEQADEFYTPVDEHTEQAEHVFAGTGCRARHRRADGAYGRVLESRGSEA